MGLVRRASYGALGGVAATIALSGLRKGLARANLVHKSAPEQVVDRLGELELLHGWSPAQRSVLVVAAHLAYGVGLGTALGMLRRRRGGIVEEAAVGSSLGLLAWAANWSSLLPLAGVHEPPWEQETPKVLLPALDHAFFGAVWALVHRTRGPRGV